MSGVHTTNTMPAVEYPGAGLSLRDCAAAIVYAFDHGLVQPNA
jgi:hypothetical protein